MSRSLLIMILSSSLVLAACGSAPRAPIDTVDRLDLARFMGDWYVIANIPTFIERGAHNAVESYELMPDRIVETRFRFRDGGFDGPLKVYRPTGFVSDDNDAVWGMQFIWPIKAEFLVLYVDQDYQRTIIGRSKRDYVWLMARKPVLSDAEYREMLDVVAAAGYELADIRKVPQRWPETRF